MVFDTSVTAFLKIRSKCVFLFSFQVGGLYMSTRLFFNISQVYLPLWLQDSLSLQATSVATIPLALFVSGFLMSLLISPLTKVIGRKVRCYLL